MSSTTPASLSYARPSLRFRPWIRRGLVLAWVVLTVYLLYDKWALRVRLQFQMLAAQRAAQRFAEPSDRVVSEGESERAIALVATPGYRDPTRDIHFEEDVTVGAVSDVIEGPWDHYWLAVRDLEWWDRRSEPPSRTRAGPSGGGGGGAKYRGGFGSGGGLFGDDSDDDHHDDWRLHPRDEALVFLHERRAAPGNARLVAVTAYFYEDGSVRFGADVLSLAGLFARPERLRVARGPLASDERVVAVIPVGGPVRLFAPQPDPTDPSRLTIPYESDGSRGAVEGRLKSDDTVEFKLLPGPAPATRPVRPRRVGNYDPANAEDHDPAADP